MRRFGLTLIILLTMIVFSFSEVQVQKVHAEETEMPYWYPENVSEFKFFHDEDRPRVVDDADIFTAEEEIKMEERILELRQQLNRDIVVFTDISTYGLERNIYCADFYDFNGYGYGDEREGFCLLICMDPNDRGFYTCSTGTVSRGLQSYRNSNLLDDRLLGYMKEADYAAGVEDWIENIAVMYRKGIPFAPDWFPDLDSNFMRFHDPAASRVVDDCDLFSESQIKFLKERISGISAQYGMDVVIHTTTYPEGIILSDQEEMFYKVYGYGLGDSFEGIMLSIVPGTYFCSTSIHTDGDRLRYFYGTSYSRLFGNVHSYFIENQPYEGAIRFLDDFEHYLKTGRVPKMANEWMQNAGVALLIGIVIGGIMLLSASRKMKAPKVKRDAYGYLDKETLKVLPLADEYLGTTVTRTYHPVSRSNSSSDDSSSYDSSYSGSSGAEHTGSGRDF